MLSKKAVLAKLSTVEDPELGMNIVDLGLIYDVKVGKKEAGKPQKASIRMTFTTPACPMMNAILDDMKAKLESFADADIEIMVVFEPFWSIDRLSEKARIKLG